MLDLQSLKAEFSATTGAHSVYSEIRYQENREIRLALHNGQLDTSLQDSTRGVSARCFTGGYWGFASYSNPNRDSAIATLREATRNAKFLAGRSEKSKIQLAPNTGVKFDKSYASTKAAMSPSIWLEMLKYLDGEIVKRYPDLIARSLTLHSLEMEKNILTSDGTEMHSVVPRAFFTISMTKMASSGHSTGAVSFQDTRGGLGQLQDHFLTAPNAFDAWIDDIYQMVSRKAEGVVAEPGVHDLILASDLAGMIVHESVGHACEADLVQSGSVANENINRLVASPLVSITDFAHSYRGIVCPQPVHVDDEGVEAEDTVIFDNGVLKNYLNNRETAHHFSQKPTGHARAYQHSDEPLIRMRNTALLPGKSSLDEMIASVQNGYILMRPGRGQADTTGEFIFSVGTGYEIKNGQLGNALRDTAVSGFAFEMLKNITMVGDDFAWDSSGYSCTKKQLMPVGIGSPSIKTRLRVGGR